MDTTLTVWICVAATVAAIVVFRLLRSVIRSARLHGVELRRHAHVVELGSEREEIWVPGDVLVSGGEIYEDYGSDDDL